MGRGECETGIPVFGGSEAKYDGQHLAGNLSHAGNDARPLHGRARRIHMREGSLHRHMAHAVLQAWLTFAELRAAFCARVFSREDMLPSV